MAVPTAWAGLVTSLSSGEPLAPAGRSSSHSWELPPLPDCGDASPLPLACPML